MANVTVIDGGRGKTTGSHEREDALKRLALQIASELPKDANEAYRVLDHVKTLVATFLAATTPV